MVKSKVETLDVRMNGLLVGNLTYFANDSLFFVYHKDWLQTPGARPLSLSLPLRVRPYMGSVVFNFFDNLLPDNESIRGRILRRFQISENHPFFLLNAIGHDCVGALQICDPAFSANPKSMQYSELSEKDVAHILRSCEQSPLGMLPENTDFRVSLAGAQEKTALLFQNNRWYLPQASTPTTHILKLPIGVVAQNQIDLSNSCENEWLCLEIAREFGIPVARSSVQIFDGTKCLVVERFDRQWSADGSWLMRLPQEDLCQALGVPSQLKYQADGGPGVADCMKLLLGAQNPLVSRETFLKALLVFWILAAPDGHAKNFSIRLNAGGRFSLSPLYDIVSFYPLAKSGIFLPKVKMAMAFLGKNNHYAWGEIQPRHFISTAKYCGFSIVRAKEIAEEMFGKIERVISGVQMRLPREFPEHVANTIFDGMRKFSN